MITRNPVNVFTAMVLLLSLTFASSCTKDSPTQPKNQGALDKTESGTPTPDNSGDLSKLTDLLRPDQMALLERGPAVLDVDQMAQLIPPGTRLQISVDLRPLQRSGLSKRIMEMVPSESLTEYREWIRDTGFNPMEQAVAGAIWADTDDYEAFAHVGTSSRAVVILNNAPLLDLLKKSLESEDDDDEDSDRKEGEFAVFAPSPLRSLRVFPR